MYITTSQRHKATPQTTLSSKWSVCCAHCSVVSAAHSHFASTALPHGSPQCGFCGSPAVIPLSSSTHLSLHRTIHPHLTAAHATSSFLVRPSFCPSALPPLLHYGSACSGGEFVVGAELLRVAGCGPLRASSAVSHQPAQYTTTARCGVCSARHSRHAAHTARRDRNG